MVKKVRIMTTWEAIRIFIADETLDEEYTECSENYRKMNLSNEESIQKFLDNDAEDVERLTPEQCEFFGLEWQDGYYISTWNNEYLSTEY